MNYLSTKLSEHAREYLLHKSTRRSDADFDLKLIQNQEHDEWKLYKTLKSANELERLEEEIQHIPDLSNKKNPKLIHRPPSLSIQHRFHNLKLNPFIFFFD